MYLYNLKTQLRNKTILTQLENVLFKKLHGHSLASKQNKKHSKKE